MYALYNRYINNIKEIVKYNINQQFSKFSKSKRL